ncbi:calmodulin [Nocardia sp. AG03]|uniref:BP74-related protein n=1 Tax=Nocardia sp. AG03 TaxID=3025312 RepID=UPI0024182213|nr:calmodulin [Nocardia sp. AG03]
MAHFALTDHTGKEFVFELNNEQRIAEARRILSGDETMSIHVMGRVRKSTKSYNPNWSFHLDPDTISFFTMAIEVCDSSIDYLEDHLDEACGAFLPGCFWCPWSSRLTREVTAAVTA